ncbi:MAG: DUF1688 family protein [Roseibium sp.]|uniref:DUF1688 family protein n=1 Tax=Roseibium sp. TaxID=1936156 RepID=UPI00260DCBCB|nr:DUF1688 family protein [Roseibium sp.]MCV0424468.1 DUF1688 family protein [Roseibium sp.]
MTDKNPALKLFDPDVVRRKAHHFLDLALVGELKHVAADASDLRSVLLNVLETTKENYPDIQIPPYGIWRDFEESGIDRWGALANARAFETAEEMLSASADLAVLACVMNTQRPENWVFNDPMTATAATGKQASSLAAFHMFAAGSFSGEMSDPYRVDAETLIRLDLEELASGLQWDLEKDAGLLEGMQRHLKRVGEALALRPDLFCEGNVTRPGLLATRLARECDGAVSATRFLDNLLEALAPVWDGGAQSDDIMLGDSFRHYATPGEETDQIVPFHLSAQEMVYSMLEPYAWAGLEVVDLECLTGPSDETHAALFLDTGVMKIRDMDIDVSAQDAQDRMIEIRAVSIALIDKLADLLRDELEVPADQLPLTCILEGGSSRAGNRVLQQNEAYRKKLGQFLNPGSVFWLPFGA